MLICTATIENVFNSKTHKGFAAYTDNWLKLINILMKLCQS